MEGYFYHGIEPHSGDLDSGIQLMIKILNEGIIVRNQARNYNIDSMDHICLYRKNNDFDYEEPNALLQSARGGWIDNCFVFIVNSEIDAKKAVVGEETNLVDEWRCYNNIPHEEIVGIAIPYEYINNYLNENYEEDKEDRQLLRESLLQLKEMASKLNIPIYDSGKEKFTDELDSTLTNFKR